MKVIASFPELEPDSAPISVSVEAETLLLDPAAVTPAAKHRLRMPAVLGLHRAVRQPVSPRPGSPARSADGVRFPLRSVIVLSVVATCSWGAAWWNDHQRAKSERILTAGMERSEVLHRPNRLARELPANESGEGTVTP